MSRRAFCRAVTTLAASSQILPLLGASAAVAAPGTDLWQSEEIVTSKWSLSNLDRPEIIERYTELVPQMMADFKERFSQC